MIGTEEMLFRLVLGAVFGGLIGAERQVHGRPAGFRTHILVCTASVLLMEVSAYYHHLSPQDPSYIRVDPGRIAAGAITGIGFLGAGVIIKLGASVQGLTTAASIWMVAAIGIATGAGLYVESGAAFVITLFSLIVLRTAERYTPHDVIKTLRVAVNCEVSDVSVHEILDRHKCRILGTDYEFERSGKCTYTIRVAFRSRRSEKAPLREVVQALIALHGVNSVSLKTL